MKIDEKIFDNLAEVSRLELNPGERAILKKDLEEMLDDAERLNELDLTGLSGMIRPLPGQSCFRADEVTNENRTEELLANAPDSSGPYFRVPRTIEE